MSVVIKFKEPQGNILINEIFYCIDDHRVQLDLNEWTLVKIKSADSVDYQIDDILIEDMSISHMKFIIYNDLTKQCNFGWIGHTYQSIPLHPNYSIFRRTVLEFIDQGDFGKTDLYEKYDFGLNNNPILTHEFPKYIHDYFNEKISPTWHKRWKKSSPWFVGIEIDRMRLFNEAMACRGSFIPRKINADSYRGWKDTVLEVKSLLTLHNIGLRHFAEVLDACRFYEISTVNVGFLPSGGFIGSHKDINPGTKPTQKIYIPIEFTPGNYFKFNPGGYAPLELPNAMCMNTDECIHAVVNDSNEGRFIIGVKGLASWD